MTTTTDTGRRGAAGFRYDAEALSADMRRLSMHVGALVRDLSGRDDLMARVGHGEEGMPPARYIPAIAEIEVVVESALPGADLADVDVTTPSGRMAHPAFVGAVAHEASHSVHTLFPMGEGLNGLEWKAWTWLEESRCEYQHLLRRPADRGFIRACITDIVASTFKADESSNDTFQAACAAALLMARVDSGVLDPDDVTEVAEMATEVLGADVVEDLRAAWTTNFITEDDDPAGQAECARAFIAAIQPALEEERAEYERLMEMFKDLFKDMMEKGLHADPTPGEPGEAGPSIPVPAPGAKGDDEEDGEGSGSGSDEDAEGEDGEGSGSGGAKGEGEDEESEAPTAGGASEAKDDYTSSDEFETAPTGETDKHEAGGHEKSMAGAVRRAAEAASEDEVRSMGEVTWERVRDADADAADAKARSEARREAEKAEQVAKRVFTRGGAGDPTHADGQRAIVNRRRPTSEERIAANVIGTALDQAKYQDRAKTTVKSLTPPGRMRGRAAVALAADRAASRATMAQPWKRVQRKHTDETTLTVGIMTDVSGSMGAAEAPIASAGWIMATAGHRVQANVASVVFGDSVTAIVYPGKAPAEVTEFSAHGGSEAFKDGFLALDGALTLLGGSGARLLVVASDNYLVNAVDSAFRTQILPRLLADGVGVLWLSWGSCDTRGLAKGVEHVDLRGMRPTDAAKVIGQAAKRAIEKASS